MELVLNDGGRAEAGFKGKTGDCVVRAIAIAEGRPYREVYDDLFALNREFAARSRSRSAKKVAAKGGTPRNGNTKEVFRPYLVGRGWTWIPTMRIGSGTTVHLRADELPGGTVICSVSGHVCTVIDGVVHDTFDPSREGTRAVYGIFVKGTEDEVAAIKARYAA